MTEADLDELVDRMAEAASAFIRGDSRRYAALMDHADDYTLMPPEGGDTRRGFDASDANLDAMAAFFNGGEATLEVVQTYTSGDLAVLVAVERQHGTVGDHPDQDLSLRVTLVFRHEGTRWRLAHRHADALVHEIPMDRVLALARGEVPR